ncbi:MAG: hypothetical protein ACI8P9_004819, partial [Parasphingorhabdus sp.]
LGNITKLNEANGALKALPSIRKKQWLNHIRTCATNLFKHNATTGFSTPA